MSLQADQEPAAGAEEAALGAPTEPGADRVERLLAGLNPPQREAVEHGEGPLLVLAGAGSGKTRVLTHRIAYLLATGAARPGEILAITFTNKAAAEMRERVGNLIGRSVRAMWVTTFHSACARMLRVDGERLGYSKGFTIYDQGDSLRMVKRCLTELGVDPKRYPPRAVQGKISGAKNQLIDPSGYSEMMVGGFEEVVAEVFPLYEKRMLEANAMDFDDLLVRTVNVLELFEDVRDRWRHTFRHVLVDEYQDTNHAQYRLLQLLAKEHGNLMVVGDEDQCLLEGTEVTMGDGSRRPIEQVRAGDEVMSAHGPGDFRPAKVTGAFRSWAREGVAIETFSGRRIVSTLEHTHFAGYRLGATPQMHLTYLMWKRGVGFRVGVSGVYTVRGGKEVGIRRRCHHEHADAVWVISAHETDAEARAAEVTLSLRYGLPMLPFVRRKSAGDRSFIGNQELIDQVFTTLDTEGGGMRLLEDEGLSIQHPHHLAATSDGRRRVLRVTLCAEKRGARPIHRIQLAGRDRAGREALEGIGLSVREAKPGSDSWRFETCVKDFGAAVRMAGEISLAVDVDVSFAGRFGAIESGRISGSSLAFMPAASVRPGMTMFAEDGNYDGVKSVERVELDRPVYDLNVAGTHNFIAEGIVTHNSVYGFRHADIRNILDFEADFPDAEMIKLEQNYRSTQTILSAANAVVSHNRERRPKELWTEEVGGEPVQLRELGDEHEEARWVGGEIDRLAEEEDVKRSGVAIFYRTNAMSRVVEETLKRYDVDYQVIGGTKFYERAEIKDAIAYLTFLVNPADLVSFGRVVNSPRRGIGDTTQGRLAAYANTAGMTIWEVIERVEEVPGLSGAAIKSVGRFFETMDALKDRVEGSSVHSVLERVLNETGYLEALAAERTVEAEGRAENLEALLEGAAEFDREREIEGDSEVPPLEEYLQQNALRTEQDALQGEERELVTLMTLHNAKGLEYDTVFIVGMEDGAFPHMRSLEEGGEEEERRLCYVGITRAERRLYLTWARERRLFGRAERNLPSRFIEEIPAELTERTSTAASGGMTWGSTAYGGGSGFGDLGDAGGGGLAPAEPLDPGPALEMRTGDDVVHASFGDGVVTGTEPGGVIVVRFSEDGKERKLMADYAPIRKR
ncbi:MAG: UvrD-helicase domain-containing protein [Actinobacteria bacterium]|nr:UvrD-helicase domain-containing protein [Actinomycetota bacterium]